MCDPHVRLLVPLKTAFKKIPEGFALFLALACSLEFGRNSKVALKLCNAVLEDVSVLSVESFAWLYAVALLGNDTGGPKDYLLQMVSSTRNVDAKQLNVGKLAGMFCAVYLYAKTCVAWKPLDAVDVMALCSFSTCRFVIRNHVPRRSLFFKISFMKSYIFDEILKI